MIQKPRILTLIKECEICNNLIERPYKETIARWEKTRFCSVACRSAWMIRDGIHSMAGKKAGEVYWSTQEARDKVSARMMGKQYALGYKHTDKAKKSMSINRSGGKHYAWKEDNASYSAVHKWLINNYGPADKCENIGCLKRSESFQYALKHDHKYIHKRESFGMLCASCHKHYDSRLNKLNVKL